MSETKGMNGRVARKSLAEQIDRLDGILDGLAEALNGAVADAVKDAVGHAVHEAVREAVAATLQAVFTDPTSKTALAARVEVERAVVPPPPARNFAARLKAATKCVSARLAGTARGWLGGLMRAMQVTRRLRKPLGLAAAVGVAIGLGCFLAGPAVAAAVSGLAGFAASLTASAFSAVRRSLALSTAPHG